MTYFVGIDLGGTNVRAAVCDAEGRKLGEGRRPSRAMESASITIAQIIEAAREAMSDAGVSAADVRAAGMGVPGRHRAKEGVVLWSPNFSKDWEGLQLLAPLREALGFPVYMENDVNVAALGEFRFGAGREVSSMVMMTLGTGIGGGIIIDGKLWSGATGSGGEIGHQVINPNGRRCGCGGFGDLEAEASQSAIVERALRKVYQGRPTVLTERLAPKYLDLTPAMIGQAASEGDALACETLAETGYFVGLGAVNALNFLNPEMVVIGGGISQAGPPLWDSIHRTVRANAIPGVLETCGVVPAELGDDAGIMGGVVLAMQQS
ncbi:MAG: ROK family protein [Armatimonadota bacterium]